MTSAFYTNFWAMIHDIREYAKNNGRAITFGRPGEKGHDSEIIEFICSKTGKRWCIYKFSTMVIDPKTAEEKRLFNIGKEDVLKMLNSKGLEHLL